MEDGKLALDGGKPTRNTPFPARRPYDEVDIAEVTEAIRSQDLFSLSGNKVARFEREFAQMYGVKHAVACTSGTAAVHMAVAALDADPGGEVITAPVTDFGTVMGILWQGLIPVFADWKPDTFNMDPAEIEKKITPKTKAILVVHLFGNPCDMEAILEIGRKRGIPVIEDCAQAYCASYRGKWVGSLGDIGCFSMQQSKHLPTGDGGAVLTDNPDYAARLALFRDKGWNRSNQGPRGYVMLGQNYRMNELTGAVACAQLRKVEQVVAAMNRLGDLLTAQIKDVPGLLPAPVAPGGKHSYWLYAFRIDGYEPQRFVQALKAEGVPVGLGYTGDPIYLCAEPLQRQKTFGSSRYPFVSPYCDEEVRYEAGLCPVAERELKQVVTFRIYETWSENDICDIAQAIRKVANGL